MLVLEENKVRSAFISVFKELIYRGYFLREI